MPRYRSSSLLAALVPALVAAATPALGVTGATTTDRTVYLSDLRPASAVNGVGAAEKDRSNGRAAARDGGALRLHGKSFAKGLGVHANSDLRYQVPAGCYRFDSTVGVDDAVGVGGSVAFSVYDGARRVYRSGIRTGTSANTEVSVPVTAGKVLRLVVAGGADGTRQDQADWAGARFTCRTGASAARPALNTAAVTGVQLLTNPGAEVDVAGWTGINGTVTRTRRPVQSGTGAFSVRAAASGNVVLISQPVRDVTAGQPFAVSAFVRSAATPRQVVLQVDWNNSAGYLGTGSTSYATTTTSGWTRLSGTLTPPAGADRARVYVKIVGGVAGEVHYVDAVGITGLPVPVAAPTAPAPAPAPTTPTPPAPSTPTPTTPPPTTTPANPVSVVPGAPTTLAWSDEFDGSALDTSKWSQKEPWNGSPGFVNDSEAYHPHPATATNFGVANGSARISARRDAVAAANGRVMTTSMLTTRDKFNTFTHGVVEARLKLPTGKGLWPGFWLLGNGSGEIGWPETGEVDIFEFVNNNAGGLGKMYSSVHWGNVSNGSITAHHSASKSTAMPWFGDDQYHTFSLHRTSQFLRFYVDGQQVMQILPGEAVPWYPTAVPSTGALFNDPMHVRFQLEVGGPWGGQGFTSSAQYETGDLLIDYVRAWR